MTREDRVEQTSDSLGRVGREQLVGPPVGRLAVEPRDSSGGSRDLEVVRELVVVHGVDLSVIKPGDRLRATLSGLDNIITVSDLAPEELLRALNFGTKLIRLQGVDPSAPRKYGL